MLLEAGLQLLCLFLELALGDFRGSGSVGSLLELAGVVFSCSSECCRVLLLKLLDSPRDKPF